MSGIEARLAQYLAQAARRRLSFATGWDCACGLLAGWVAAERGVDLAAPWRGRYRTALGCARLLAREGGLVAVISRAAQAAGLYVAVAPRPGDAGLVLLRGPGGLAPTGAILTAWGWAALAPVGLVTVADVPVLAAWEV